MVMVAKVVTRNIEELKGSEQTFETIFRIIRESLGNLCDPFFQFADSLLEQID